MHFVHLRNEVGTVERPSSLTTGSASLVGRLPGEGFKCAPPSTGAAPSVLPPMLSYLRVCWQQAPLAEPTVCSTAEPEITSL